MRFGDAALVLLPGNGEGVLGDPADGPELRHRLLGHCRQPTP